MPRINTGYCETVQIRQAIDTSSVGSAFYGHQLQQQQQQHQAGSLLHHRHHHYQYHQQRASSVRNTFQADCHGDRCDAIPQFDAAAAGRRQMSTDAAVLGTSLHRIQQRQSEAGFGASRGVPEMSDHACVDRYDCVLLGCDQFAKISYNAACVSTQRSWWFCRCCSLLYSLSRTVQ